MSEMRTAGTTRWRITAFEPYTTLATQLTIELESDDPAVIELVEDVAAQHGVRLERV